MRVTEIVVSLSEKVNLGNYETRDFFISLKAEIEYDESIDVQTSTLFDKCREVIAREIHKKVF